MKAFLANELAFQNDIIRQLQANGWLLGDFPKAIDDAVMDSSDAHQNQMMQLLSDPAKATNFARIVFDLLKEGEDVSAK